MHGVITLVLREMKSVNSFKLKQSHNLWAWLLKKDRQST